MILIQTRVFGIACFLGLVSQSGLVKADCAAMARTDYERIYCELEELGSRNLPDFSQFQRNTPATQALLLRRPAARLGIVLPKPDDVDAEIDNRVNSTVNPASVQNDRMTADLSDAPINTVFDERPASLRASFDVALECQQRELSIRCGNKNYVLVSNRHNRQLLPNVLTDTNKMVMPRFNGDPQDDSQVDGYLSEAYRYYINKMLEIGLGGVTMSYTRFYYTYQDLQLHQVSFVDRFSTMYEFLKKDKSTLLVADGAKPAFSGLDYCMPLDEQLIVCDNSSSNWVYQHK